MFGYYFTLALNNIRRQMALSLLISITLGVGIATCMVTYSLIYLMSKDPLPNKSQNVYRIQLDNWKLNEAATPPDLPPEQVTWQDAMNITHAKEFKYQAANALTWGMVTPDAQSVAPFLGIIRATHSDFFPMFDVPFIYGQGWQNLARDDVRYVTVLSKKTNERVFSGQNSVGQTLPMLGKLFTVVGVLDDWHPSPKYFDLSFGPFSEPEDLYIPLQLKAELELPHGGHSNCWETDLEEVYSAFLRSECVNFNLWVELSPNQHIADLQDYLSRYVEQQKSLGRFPKPVNNIALNLTKWLEHKKVVGSDIYLFFYLALLFLLVCLFNAASLVSTKFTSKSAEVALRRALGADQTAVFVQCIIESTILGLVGAILGLVLCTIGLEGIKLLYPNFSSFVQMNGPLISIAMFCGVLSSLLASILPTIAVCKLAPAAYLK